MKINHVLCAAWLTAAMALPSKAADECQLYFQFTTNTGQSVNRILDLDQGEARVVQQARIRQIQNKKAHPINVEITNLWPPYGRKWVTLNSAGATDPPAGVYTGNVTLFNVECGGGQGENVPQQFAQTVASGLMQATQTAGLVSLEQTFAGFTSGYHAIPTATPAQNFPLNRGANQVTFRGKGLMGVSTVTGLAAGAVVQIAGRGATSYGTAVWDYLHVNINVPASVAFGATGTGRLMVNGTAGPTFRWVIQQPQAAVAQMPPPPTRGAGPARPDLVPSPFVGTLYKVGTATTMDAGGDTFTALDPFNGSSFCQGVPQGAVNRSNMPTSNRQTITVPNITWGVRNTSGVNVATGFTIRLMRGQQQVASQTVNGLAAGETREFTYQRPQSQTTVARVGLGDGCYHVGLSSQGWNDNAGYRVQVDVGNAVAESSEGNNVREIGDRR